MYFMKLILPFTKTKQTGQKINKYRSISLINTNEIMPNKILAKRIQLYTKRMQGYFNI